MKRAVLVAAASVAVAAGSHTVAQSGREETKLCLAALIQARVESRQPVRLSARTITLTGDTLRLSGRARIWFDDVSILADEAAFDRTAKRIDLDGNVNA